MLRMAERESFEELALPLLDSLYRYARWLTKNVAEAEDLVQEAYLKGFRGYESFIAGSNIRAWMFRILRNTFLTSRTGLRVSMAGTFVARRSKSIFSCSWCVSPASRFRTIS